MYNKYNILNIMNTSHLEKWFNTDTSKINSMLDKTNTLCKRHFTFNKNTTKTNSYHERIFKYFLIPLTKRSMFLSEI